MNLFLRFWFCLLLYASSIIAEEPKVHVNTSTNALSPLRLKFSGISEPLLVEGSEDLTDWSKLFVAGNLLNGLEVTAPVEPTSTKRSFFRLAPLSAPLKLRTNTIPGSPYLGCITNYGEVHIDFFGTRDSEGLPKEITQIVHRVGDRTLITQASVVSGEESTGTNSADNVPQKPLRCMKGTVYVKRGGNCPLPNMAPTVLFSCLDGGEEDVGGILKGSVPCIQDESKSNEDYKAYSYSVPVEFSQRLSVESDIERWDRAIETAIRAGLNLAIENNHGLVGDAADIYEYFGIIKPGSIASRLFLVKTRIQYFLGGLVAGVAGTNVLLSDTAPLNPEADGFGVADQAIVKAVFLSGPDTHRYSSSEVVVWHPTLNSGPDLFIETTCENRIEPIFDDSNRSYIRNIVAVSRNGYERNKIEDLQFPTQLPSGKETKMDFTEPFAYAAGKISAAATLESVTIQSSNTLVLAPQSQQSGHSDSDSHIVFRIASDASSPVDGFTLVQLETQTSGIELTGTIGQSNNQLLELRGNKSSRVWLKVDEVYTLKFFHRKTIVNSSSETINGRVKLSLLGSEIEPFGHSINQ